MRKTDTSGGEANTAWQLRIIPLPFGRRFPPEETILGAGPYFKKAERFARTFLPGGKRIGSAHDRQLYNLARNLLDAVDEGQYYLHSCDIAGIEYSKAIVWASALALQWKYAVRNLEPQAEIWRKANAGMEKGRLSQGNALRIRAFSLQHSMNEIRTKYPHLSNNAIIAAAAKYHGAISERTVRRYIKKGLIVVPSGKSQ